jgi:hypothetical protein
VDGLDDTEDDLPEEDIIKDLVLVEDDLISTLMSWR